MGKITTYVCNKCGTKSGNKDGWLEIKANGGLIDVENNLKDRHLISMNRHQDLHFCCSKCFVNLFVDTTHKYDDLLETRIINDKLVISIGLNSLKCSIESGRLDTSTHGEFILTDLDKFMKDFIGELRGEEEDGSTPLHLLFDKIALSTLEKGGRGCEVVEGR